MKSLDPCQGQLSLCNDIADTLNDSRDLGSLPRTALLDITEVDFPIASCIP